jgi:dUTP pyrophosphatase
LLIKDKYTIKNMSNYTLRYTSQDDDDVLRAPALPGDVGVDIEAISVHKRISNRTVMYETGIAVEPPEGTYVEIVPRSSIVKTGYVLANSMGIVDRGYRGTLKIVLTKVDPTKPDLITPFKVCQLVLRPYLPITLKRVKELTPTVREDAGFGSTN